MGPDFVAQVAAVVTQGEATNGLIRASVNGTGGLVELVVDPKAMRLAADALAAAVRDAVCDAQALARSEVAGLLASASRGAPDIEQLSPGIAELRHSADQMFAQMSETLGGLLDRADRRNTP